MTQTKKMRTGYHITDKTEIKAILDNCERCRIGLSEQGTPYVVPLNYGYTYDNDILTIYFHSGFDGRKMEIIRESPLACFEVDCDYKLDPDKRQDGNAVKWESIIGTGIIQEVRDIESKKKILGNMMKKFHEYNQHYRPNALTDSRVINVGVFKLVLDEFKAKRIFHT